MPLGRQIPIRIHKSRPGKPWTVSGEFRVDPHVKVLDERVVDRATDRGLDALVYAPHFTRLPDIEARAEAFSGDDLLVVPGREIFTGNWRTRKHVLAMGLEAPIPDFISLEGAMAELERQDAVVLVPHPEYMTMSLDAEDIWEYRDRLDAIEVYNTKYRPCHDRRALELAEETGLPTFASSYAHLQGTVGEAWTAFDEPFATVDELVEAFETDTPRRAVHRDDTDHRVRHAVELAHLLYENTWQKVDRVLLSGTEPTHPGHIAYAGRFDDVAVY